MSYQIGRGDFQPNRKQAPPPTPEQAKYSQAVSQAITSTPQGYQLKSVKPQLSPYPSGHVGVKPVKEYVATYTPVQKEVPTSAFGPKVSYYNPSTGVMTEQVVTRKGEKIFVTADLSGGPPSPHTRMALTGFGLATTTSVGVAIPIVGAGGLGAVGVGEGIKRVTTGKDLTVEEAVSLAGIGELGTAGLLSARSALYPRVQRSVDASYRIAVENQQLFKPSLVQKVGMRFTGVKPSGLASELVGAGESPPLSFRMLQQGRLNAIEEDYFWSNPTPRSSEVYAARVAGSRAKMWAGEQLIRRVSGGLSYSLIQRELEHPLERKIPFTPEITRAISVRPEGAKALLFSSYAVGTTTQPKLLQRTMQRQKLIRKSDTALVQAQTLDLDQSQALRQEQKQIQGLVQQQRQMQTQTQKQKLDTQLVPNIPTTVTYPKLTGFPRGGGSDFGGFSRGLRGGWRKTRHPVKPWNKMLETFGYKPSKSMVKLSKVSSLGFGKANKRRGSKRGKRGR